MKSAAVLALVTILGLAVFLKSGLSQESATRQPQTSPPRQAQPEPPQFTEDHEQAMKEKERRVMIIFGAEWCPHCVVLKEHLKGSKLDGYLVCLVDADENNRLMKEYKVKSLPTSVILEGGEEISRIKGFDRKKFDNWMEQNRR